MTGETNIDVGVAALAEGRWQDARRAFEAALVEAESPEALGGMGTTLWWMGEPRLSVEYQERAYAEFGRAGNAALAVSTALALATTYISNFGNEAAARGWVARAERLLVEPGFDELRGWVWVTRGYLTTELGEALDLLQRSLDFAREAGDPDLELVALADLGEKLVMAGRIEEGLALVDEAMAGSLGGERLRLDTVVFACCDMLVACDLAGDLKRATQWCRVADRFINRYGCPFLYARCRTLYGSVLVAKGQWAEAEKELTSALHMTDAVGPGLHTEALARLADLRLRQGRFEEAEALLATLDDAAAALPAAALRLARREPGVAAAILQRHLRRVGEHHIHTALALSMLVQTDIELGDIDAAIEAARRLDAVAEKQTRGQAGALALLTSARIAAAKGAPGDIIPSLEKALEHFLRLDLPLEAARVRIELAHAMATQNSDAARAEAQSALTVFDQLGAAADANAADSLLRSLGGPGRTGRKQAGVLTNREQEVLHLVSLGLSNPEIAERLFISRKTAAHHVSSILTKLGLRNRAEAVAYAARSAT